MSYVQSKLANILHAKGLSRRLKEEGVNIMINCVHPGLIMTNLMRRSFAHLRSSICLLCRAQPPAEGSGRQILCRQTRRRTANWRRTAPWQSSSGNSAKILSIVQNEAPKRLSFRTLSSMVQMIGLFSGM